MLRDTEIEVMVGERPGWMVFQPFAGMPQLRILLVRKGVRKCDVVGPCRTFAFGYAGHCHRSTI